MTLQRFKSAEAASEALSEDRQRLRAEGKEVAEVPGLGDRCVRATGPKSIEYVGLSGMEIGLAVAADATAEHARFQTVLPRVVGSLLRRL